MIAGRRWAILVSLSLPFSIPACGGAVGESASSFDAGPAPVTDAGPPTATGSSAADAATSDAQPPLPSTGVLWVRGEASSFDPRACKDPASSDFSALGDYLETQMRQAGMKGASINAGGGVCAFGTSPTTLSETYVFTGTGAAVQALKASPPAPFHGTYVTVPLVVKEAVSVKFELFVGDLTARAFDDVWVHEGLDFEGEAGFMTDICNQKTSFDAAIATSPMGDAVKAWLAGKNAGAPYELGYDATLSFDDGSTLKIANAHQAAGGPYLAPCPNPMPSP